mmetsp:Transcript_10498/g.33244  ORF Transcript_10498/g.33244 Transcript_10498/m.33244 type:complete len:259 (+) Transcript_10498:645-1421(+)
MPRGEASSSREGEAATSSCRQRGWARPSPWTPRWCRRSSAQRGSASAASFTCSRRLPVLHVGLPVTRHSVTSTSALAWATDRRSFNRTRNGRHVVALFHRPSRWLARCEATPGPPRERPAAATPQTGCRPLPARPRLPLGQPRLRSSQPAPETTELRECRRACRPRRRRPPVPDCWRLALRQARQRLPRRRRCRVGLASAGPLRRLPPLPPPAGCRQPRAWRRAAARPPAPWPESRRVLRRGRRATGRSAPAAPCTAW